MKIDVQARRFRLTESLRHAVHREIAKPDQLEVALRLALQASTNASTARTGLSVDRPSLVDATFPPSM